jgi:hypothetical protein
MKSGRNTLQYDILLRMHACKLQNVDERYELTRRYQTELHYAKWIELVPLNRMKWRVFMVTMMNCGIQ